MVPSIRIILSAVSADTYIDPSFIDDWCGRCRTAQVIACHCTESTICIHGNPVEIAAFGRKIDISIVINDGGADIADHVRAFVDQLSGMRINRIQDRSIGITGPIIGTKHQIIVRRISTCPVKTSLMVIFPGTVFYLIAL